VVGPTLVSDPMRSCLSGSPHPSQIGSLSLTQMEHAIMPKMEVDWTLSRYRALAA
jgi:hypothetical protein